ncbi:hypothetical protein M0R45_005261 [Rubus argutus]|uniref:Uncharacterized protein n=1 Tax=Rubus argutus TaxID=59490 RepID=A0AAW1YM51_RUBAR
MIYPFHYKPPDSRNPSYYGYRGARGSLPAEEFQTPAVRGEGETPAPAQVQVPKLTKSAKIVLQPRLCTLRSYGSDLDGE